MIGKMKRALIVICIMALAITLVPSALQAASADYWITRKGETTPITSMSIGGIGSTFELSVWYTVSGFSTDEPLLICSFIGYDHTAGQAFAPIDGKLSLDSTSVNMGLNFDDVLNNSEGGAYDPTDDDLDPLNDAVRPYGTSVALGVTNRPYGYATSGRLFDISLRNDGLGSGESYALKLYSLGGYGDEAFFWQSMANGYIPGGEPYDPANAYAYPGAGGTWSKELVVTAPVPEPSSMAVLATGLLGFIGFAARRRS